MKSFVWLATAFAIGCMKDEVPPDVVVEGTPSADADADADADDDGYDSSVDCDDSNAGVYPGAPEVCDGMDNDCDDLIDDDDELSSGDIVLYVDGDGDGYGNADLEAIEACTADVPGFAPASGDCNDDDSDIHPGAEEACDGIDNDCNDLIDAADPALVDGDLYWLDSDGDGFGGATDSVIDCAAPDGYSATNNDCDDSVSSVGPPTDWYTDSDGDGYGSTFAGTACEPSTGWVADDGDCNDADDGVHPAAIDYCGDGDDDDCSGESDDWGPECTDLEPQNVVSTLSCLSDEIDFISTGLIVEGDRIAASYGISGNWDNSDTASGLEIKPSGSAAFTETTYHGTAMDYLVLQNSGRTHRIGHPYVSDSGEYTLHCSDTVSVGDVIGVVHTFRKSSELSGGIPSHIDVTKKELWNQSGESMLIEYEISPSVSFVSYSFSLQRFIDFKIDYGHPEIDEFEEYETDFTSDGRTVVSSGPISQTSIAIGPCANHSLVGSDVDWSPIMSAGLSDEVCDPEDYQAHTPTILQADLSSSLFARTTRKRFVLSIGNSASAATAEWNSNAEAMCGTYWDEDPDPDYPGDYCDGRPVFDHFDPPEL